MVTFVLGQYGQVFKEEYNVKVHLWDFFLRQLLSVLTGAQCCTSIVSHSHHQTFALSR